MQNVSLMVAAGILLAVSGTASGAPAFVDWTSFNISANTADGVLGGNSVQLSGGGILAGGVTDESSSIFNLLLFTP